MPLPGHEVVVDASPFEARPFGLAVDVYDELEAPGLVDPRTGGLRWLNGVAVGMNGCVTGLTAHGAGDMCTGSVQYATAPEDVTEGGDFVNFYAFRVEHALKFTTICGLSVEDAEERVKAAFELASSAMLARQVLTAQFETANPSLSNQADNMGGDLSVVGALASVEDGLAQLILNGRGLIHVTPGMLTRLGAAGVVVLDNDQYRTRNGHRIVADAGYAGYGAQAGQARIFGSGPVRYRTTGIKPVGMRWENFDLERNTQTVRFEEYMLAVFEPCPVVSAVASVDTVADLPGGI